MTEPKVTETSRESAYHSTGFEARRLDPVVHELGSDAVSLVALRNGFSVEVARRAVEISQAAESEDTPESPQPQEPIAA